MTDLCSLRSSAACRRLLIKKHGKITSDRLEVPSNQRDTGKDLRLNWQSPMGKGKYLPAMILPFWNETK